jgi:hypothetical protein
MRGGSAGWASEFRDTGPDLAHGQFGRKMALGTVRPKGP